MIKLELQVRKEKITIDENIRNSFNHPIVFYLVNRKNLFLNTFVIVNFQKQEITYYKTYTKNNIETFQKNNLKKIVTLPHSATSTKDGLFSFLFGFSDKEYFFRYLNIKEKSFTILSAEDLNHKDINNLGLISETSGLDDDPNYFYIACMDKGQTYTNYYKSSIDLNNVVKIGTDPGTLKLPPHIVIKFKNYLFGSGFNELGFKFPNGDICKDIDGYLWENSQTRLNKNSTINNHYMKNNLYAGKTFSEITNLPQFKYKILDGTILIWDLKKGNFTTLSVKNKPSHIEIDENNLYVASNNLIILKGTRYQSVTEENKKGQQRLTYLAPGAIERIEFKNDEFKRGKVFEDETAYRISSHKLFKRNGVTYIATLGFPNRIFIINGDSMKLEYYYDVDKEILSNIKDIRLFLNDNYPILIDDPLNLTSFELSDDGKYLVFFSQTNIRFFDIDLKEIVYEIPFTRDKDFFQYTIHCDTLKQYKE